jgi:hypothetical protein
MRECKLRFRSKASKLTKAIRSAHGSPLKFGPIGICIARIVIARSYIERRQTCQRLTSIALAAGRAFN